MGGTAQTNTLWTAPSTAARTPVATASDSARMAAGLLSRALISPPTSASARGGTSAGRSVARR